MRRLRLPNPWKPAPAPPVPAGALGGAGGMSGSRDLVAVRSGAGAGAANGAASAEARNGLLWRIQSLLRRREAESVRDRMEELIEEQDLPAGEGALVRANGLDPQERALLGNVLKLRGKTASDVMVPRADIMAMPDEFTLGAGDPPDPARRAQPLPRLQRPARRDRGHGPHQGRVRRGGAGRRLRHEGDPPPAAAGGALRAGARPAACRCARRASTWRWWWTSTAASTAS